VVGVEIAPRADHDLAASGGGRGLSVDSRSVPPIGLSGDAYFDVVVSGQGNDVSSQIMTRWRVN
jgi:hypothetical protein